MALQYLLAPTFQFVNTAGKPLSGGAYMEVYVHGTRTKYFCASDFNGTLHPFRIPLDSLGSNIVLANDTGSYDVYAYNRYGTLMMSRYNVKPGAGGGIGGTITSTDGSIDIHPTEDGVDLSVNGLDPSCLKVSADPRTTDGKFHFDSLIREGDQAYVDNEGAIRLLKGWYHFTANVQLAWNAGARNETHQVTLYTTLSNSVIDFDISHVHTETIELSGDVSIASDGSELVIGVSGMPTGLEASVISMDVHAITGKDGHDKYYAGNGITISNENYIAVDFDEVQEKLVAGDGVTIEGNVISAPTLVQAQADWTEEDTESRSYIRNKPDLDVFATKTEVNAGLAGKQNTIPDLAAIRSGATAGASAVQPADLAAVATTGDYNSLNNRPNLTVYATKTEVNTGLAAKQDVISDLSAIRAGAQLGATAVQPADLNAYATDTELAAGLATKQDTINDLSEIRSGAAAGSTAVQPADLAAVATTGDYDSLSNRPTIPSGAQLVPAATSADADKVLTVDAQGTPAWAEAQAPISAGDGISISNNVVSVKVDGTTVTVNASGELQAAPAITVDQTYDSASTNPQSGTAVAEAVAGVDTGLFVAQYGVTTYSQVVAAIEANKIVYCRFSGDWSDSRMAFLAYDAHTSANGNVEFQYVRSNSNSSGTDSIFVYKLFRDNTWTTTESTVKAGNISYPVTRVNVNGASAMTGTVANITIPAAPTVDQTYDASSANAQSGVAVAQAIASIPSSSYTAGTGIDITNNIVSVDTSVVATQTDLASKQDVIQDLSTIRSGAAAGATAVQDPDYVHTDENFTSSEKTKLSGIEAGAQVNVNADWNAASGTDAYIANKPQNLVQDASYVHTDENFTSSDKSKLAGIEAGAEVNVKPDWNAAAGSDDEILNKPSIPSGTQLVPAATSADADKVLTVNAQGTPAWATAQAPISAGDGISITNNVVSAKVDGTTIDTNASGELTVIGGGGGDGADWDAEQGEPGYIENKPVPKTLVAGTGITITESSTELTVAATGGGSGVTDVEVDGTSVVSGGVASITMPTVDQTYNALSTNAQSGVAVASAISAIGSWVDVSTEAQYNTTPILAGGFEIKYNATLKLVSVTADVNLDAGATNIFTWSNRLKPVANAFALGNGLNLYVSQTSLNQPAAATQRWVNGVWMWPVVGDN